jgi:hypothetical protein
MRTFHMIYPVVWRRRGRIGIDLNDYEEDSYDSVDNLISEHEELDSAAAKSRETHAIHAVQNKPIRTRTSFPETWLWETVVVR